MSLLLDIRVGSSLREGSWKQVYLLPASQQHQSSSAPLPHELGPQGFCQALSFSCEHLMESRGNDLENGYLEPLCRRSPRVLNSHLTTLTLEEFVNTSLSSFLLLCLFSLPLLFAKGRLYPTSPLMSSLSSGIQFL